MKIRKGFVSNSSSSSFIISSKKKPVMTIEIELDELSTEITNKEELDDYFTRLDYYDTIEEMLEEEGNKEQYDMALAELAIGDTIYAGDVSSDSGNELESLIYSQGFSGNCNFKVIQGVG
jgi:hypothetical protein